MRRQDALAESVLQSRGLFMRYMAGFDDSNYTRTAEHLPNHAAWVLGHCALTMHRAAERVDGRLQTGDAFVDGAAGDGSRFGTESVAFGSDPRSAETKYPGYRRCVEIFGSAADRLAGALRSCPEGRLDEPVPFFGGMSLPRWNAAPRIVFHNGTHCGQIVDLRRALGMSPIFR